ncbi:hypothetical protein VTP01DRAFT_6761 [Rhizomucor pusillus]|uniref:uncharacterized protein n=1 Tax=Rhizomucor pusillus TaxID=4840 RepID=UPI00374315D4
MGAHASKDAQGSSRSQTEKSQRTGVDSIDYGSVLPNGLYPTSQQEYDLHTVRNLILARKLAPFYKGLADIPEDNNNVGGSKAETSAKKIQQAIYSDAIECPICFLYYPSNMNYSRCCDQPICTECFLQTAITAASCPYCTQKPWGIVYSRPSWLFDKDSQDDLTKQHTRQTDSDISTDTARSHHRKAISHTDPNVVLAEHVRPSRNKPQNATRPTPRRNSESVNNNRARGLLRTAVSSQLFGRPGRSASSAAAPEYNPHHHARYMRDLDLDLEDYLVLEAIRMSLAEYEQSQQRRTEEERNRNTTENGTDQQQPEAAATAAAAGVSASSSPCAATTITETRPADNSDNPMSSESDPENAEPKTCQNREIVSNPSPNTLN